MKIIPYEISQALYQFGKTYQVYRRRVLFGVSFDVNFKFAPKEAVNECQYGMMSQIWVGMYTDNIYLILIHNL